MAAVLSTVQNQKFMQECIENKIESAYNTITFQEYEKLYNVIGLKNNDIQWRKK